MPLMPWRNIGSRYLIRDRWLTLRADRCATAYGAILDPYYVQEPEDWVQIVAFDAHDRILVVRQYRHGAGVISTELPCGVVERGELPDRAAARELLEETGCEAQSWEALPVLSPNPARYSNRVHGFIATGVRQLQSQQLDATEEIEFAFLPVDDVLTLIEAGAWYQALHLGSIFLALRRRGLTPGTVHSR